MGLTAVLTYARVWDQTDEQMYDRAYRLRYNKGQVLMDKVCIEINVHVHIYTYLYVTKATSQLNVSCCTCKWYTEMEVENLVIMAFREQIPVFSNGNLLLVACSK